MLFDVVFLMNNDQLKEVRRELEEMSKEKNTVKWIKGQRIS